MVWVDACVRKKGESSACVVLHVSLFFPSHPPTHVCTTIRTVDHGLIRKVLHAGDAASNGLRGDAAQQHGAPKLENTYYMQWVGGWVGGWGATGGGGGGIGRYVPAMIVAWNMVRVLAPTEVPKALPCV